MTQWFSYSKTCLVPFRLELLAKFWHISSRQFCLHISNFVWFGRVAFDKSFRKYTHDFSCVQSFSHSNYCKIWSYEHIPRGGFFVRNLTCAVLTRVVSSEFTISFVFAASKNEPAPVVLADSHLLSLRMRLYHTSNHFVQKVSHFFQKFHMCKRAYIECC